jgi:hypothetical protein
MHKDTAWQTGLRGRNGIGQAVNYARKLVITARVAAVRHGHETYGAHQMRRADRVDLASGDRQPTRRRRALIAE